MAIGATIPELSDYPSRETNKPATISVVTTVRNAERTLLRTIESVRSQAYPGLEYVIADAGSTDGTLDIIRASGDIVSHWQSERDRGISDGFNKGIALSSGKYVLLLNADDWLSPGQLARGVETLEKTGADFVFGDLIYHDATGSALHRIRGEADYARRIGHVMPALNHPTVIVRRDAYARVGLFDLSLKLAMDYEFLLRLHRAGGKGIYDPRMVGHMALAGASDTFSAQGLAEVRDISIRYGAAPVMAWLRYGFRQAKGRVRRSLTHFLHPAMMKRLRRVANRNFVGLGG